jgi:hypothetical protein
MVLFLIIFEEYFLPASPEDGGGILLPIVGGYLQSTRSQNSETAEQPIREAGDYARCQETETSAVT